MRKLIINNVGPITKNVEIEFRRFCILIGPQSNGKSTIAKILSTCMWLEKEMCTSLSESLINEGKAFASLIEDFHRMHNYIHPDSSYISYSSPFVKITYDRGELTTSYVDNEGYRRNKISYIPSDRNVVTMKDIEKRNLEPTNFRSFLFDWLDATPSYDLTHLQPILNLGVKYYFDSQKEGRRDMLMHENGVSYAIPLYDASSGMQSVVPMTVLMHYLVDDYFDEYDKDQSFERTQKKNALAWKIVEMLTKRYFPDKVANVDYKVVYDEEVKKKADAGDERASSILKEMLDLFKNLTSPQSVSFILEEPEQNLFPETQVELFNDSVALCNGKHPSAAFITTHSPYILAAANILLFAGKLRESGVDAGKLAEITKTSSFLYESEFTAYSVAGGTCESIIDSDTGLIKENELDCASDYNAENFDSLYELYTSNIRKL